MVDGRPVSLWGAGSLRLPFLGEGGVFADARPVPECRFGPSGTLADAILAGGQWDLFCSADLERFTFDLN